ncbi:NYN domain-containing protein [Prosthecobacter sp.]|uniref:NYN domain-containing protein n=1 Tax=Prosthecobacter sp. TaxID=1965333 RepID=UPI0026000B13|nr:NYN domain-containing protein [Prosthecobacter sp.]
MATHTDRAHTIAVFCDFENLAIGVKDAKYDKFDMNKVLDRLLLKGSIVVKKAYCDWDRYKSFKAAVHEASFELIEIPHVRQSGKNSADIRMVVDALDLCYTKPHVDTFAIVSGDSDFSPLVSKLRENNKTVIGVGVKQSTSGLFIDNCDEFIFYDDLVREEEKTKSRLARAKPAPKANAPEKKSGGDPEKAIQMVVETVEAMLGRSGSDTVWAGPVKQAIRRRQPQFDERFYGFSTFSALLEAAAERGLMKLEKNENGYRIKVSASEE